MMKQEESKPIYYSIPNTTLKLDDCNSVSFFEFPTHIEATARTYTIHFKTNAEIKRELN